MQSVANTLICWWSRDTSSSMTFPLAMGLRTLKEIADNSEILCLRSTPFDSARLSSTDIPLSIHIGSTWHKPISHSISTFLTANDYSSHKPKTHLKLYVHRSIMHKISKLDLGTKGSQSTFITERKHIHAGQQKILNWPTISSRI